MIVLVTGGRDYADVGTVFDAIVTLNENCSIDLLVHGAADGADSLADTVCKELGIDRVSCPANWTKHKKAAGPIRNGKMLEYFPNIDLVLAFPGGTGTANMKEQASKKNIPVIEALDLLKDEHQKG